jgi:phosphonate transport system ATP-binding protein
LIGPSGAGKSTLLGILTGALKPSEGSLHWQGKDFWSLNPTDRQQRRADFFLAPQTPPLPPRQRAVHSVLAGRLPQQSNWAALRSLIKPKDAHLAQAALAAFALEDKLFLRVDQLSGGERQRVGLARAHLSQAKLLCYDEPISALDPNLSSLALLAIKAEATRRQAMLICGLHDVDMALAHFERVIALKQGKLQFDCPRSEVTDAMLSDLYAHDQFTRTEQRIDTPSLPQHACV